MRPTNEKGRNMRMQSRVFSTWSRRLMGKTGAAKWIKAIVRAVFLLGVGFVMVYPVLDVYKRQKLRFVGQRPLSSLIKVSLLFSVSAMMIPRYIVMSNLHMFNTYCCLLYTSRCV